ncbi:LysR family transcriptional regulator [Christensenellaceae bacterium OttesenSCG-928-M15]|nr:LysR family transcriptional regulator [Christensenellaceae bacterium OttesenSCG-928-M15]
MEFRQLEAFKLVVETGSFSEAAKQMGIKQPSVSAQISALEQEFGNKLLLRQPGNATPTKTGKTLYRYCVDILALRDKAASACFMPREMSGTITIAASSIPYQFVLPVLCAQFSLQYSHAKFELMGSDSAGAVDMVLKGQASLGVVGTVFDSDQLEFIPILEDELVAITPAMPPYSGWSDRPIEVEALMDAPFVAREAGSGTWVEIAAYLEQRGYDSGALRVVAQMDNPDAIAKAVEQGLGVTMLSSLAASEYKRRGNVLVFPLAGSPAKRKLYLVRLKTAKLSAVTRAFSQFAAGRGNES